MLTQQTKKNFSVTDNRGMSGIGVMVTLVVVVAISAATYLQWGDSLGMSPPTVNEIVAAHQSVDQFQHETSVAVTANLDPEALASRDDADQLRRSLRYLPDYTASGNFPETVTGTVNVSGNITVASSSDSSAAVARLAVALGTDQTEEVLAVDWRRVDGVNYFRGSTLPETDLFPLQQLEGQWYAASSTQAVRTMLSATNFSTTFNGVPADTELSPETTAELAAALFSEGVLEIANTTKTELRSGAPAYQLDLQINPDAVSDYQREARRLVADDNPSLAESDVFSADSTQMQELQSNLRRAKEQLDQISLWVARDSSRLRRVKVTSDITADDIAELSEDGTDTTGITDATLTVDIGLSAYNQPISIRAPEDARPFEQLFGGLLEMGVPTTIER